MEQSCIIEIDIFFQKTYIQTNHLAIFFHKNHIVIYMQINSLWIIISLVALLLVIGIVILLRPIGKKPQRGHRKFSTKVNQYTLPMAKEANRPAEDSIQLQLEILHEALNITTAAFLWSGSNEEEMQVINVVSLRDDIVKTPFSRGIGAIGGLRRNCPEITVCPVPDKLPVPYYSSRKNVGALLAFLIPLCPDAEPNDLPATAILVLDRNTEEKWSDQELKVARLTCKKISSDLRLDKKIEETCKDKEAINKICLGLQELNQAMGLESVFAATTTTVKQLTRADFTVISLLQNDQHCIVKASGPKADKLEGLAFDKEDGLVGQAIKLKRWMPTHSNYEDAPVFSNEMRLGGLKSLLIIPLLTEDNEPVGALTVAGKTPGLFTKERQDLLKVIVGQITTKIELGRAHEKIYKLATTDGLTGLSNHRTFQLAMDNMLNRATRQKSPLSMVLCDLDHFKNINDTYGHPFGDVVLKEVSLVLANTIRTVDLAARYGGEEFALLLENSKQQGAMNQAERVRKAIADLTFQHEGEIIKISMSLGIASFPNDADNKNDLISKADQALYQAKDAGRNRTVAWAEAMIKKI